jgi:hypothetical protein
MSTREQYHAAFVTEREQVYPAVTLLEKECGFAVPTAQLLAAARILACPVKANPPNWQHGRILYAIARKHLLTSGGRQHWIDIGTAKGFSACVMSWALADSNRNGDIRSFDVINPLAHVARNSVADTESLQTVPELTEPFRAPGYEIEWHGTPFCEWWYSLPSVGRIHLAFIDGRHKYEAVWADLGLITSTQEPGDLIMFDDLQIDGVARAVKKLRGYAIYEVWAKPSRGYAVAVKS